MENFTEVSNNIVEFKSNWLSEKQKSLLNASIQTDRLPSLKSQSIQTNEKRDANTGTEEVNLQHNIPDEKIAAWLKKIYPLVEAELLEGVTPIYDSNSYNFDSEILIRPYQKIPNSSSSIASHVQGTATWLSVRTNNAPILAISSSPMHTDWCEHVHQSVKIYIPKRLHSQDYIVFTEVKAIPVNSCIKMLATNPFNKDIFGGGTVSGDLYIWKFGPNNEPDGVQELFRETTQHGCIGAMDWCQSNSFLTCHANGIICLWKIAKELIKEMSFQIKGNKNNGVDVELTAIVCISQNEFIIGTNEGRLLLCSSAHVNLSSGDKQFYDPVISELERHEFQITSILKTSLQGSHIIISCDLSGQVVFYDIQSADEGPTLIVKMPLPFKNAITCTKNGEYLFCPGDNGILDVFKVSSGGHSLIDGNLQGKGNFIKISDNGCWIVTGVYKGYFQLFHTTE